ncbi:MAG: 50S ribosomal protein L10 [Deltaproteobacteria bacterium]|nr:50S ribosomal protein L10 [Deltaproteobacteria bacterium]
MNRAEKAQIIEALREKAETANIAIVTDFKGLKVEETNPLRIQLREQNVDFQVVKNTLAGLAFKDTKHAAISEQFKECCAVAFGYDDPVVASKIVLGYAKKNKKFSVRFASLDGTFLDADSLTQLSELPGREQLLAQMLGTMNAVPGNFVRLFANLIRNMLYALNAIKEQKEQV